MADEEWVESPNQPTYEPGEPGVTVTPIPVMIRKKPEKKENPEEPKEESHAQ